MGPSEYVKMFRYPDSVVPWMFQCSSYSFGLGLASGYWERSKVSTLLMTQSPCCKRKRQKNHGQSGAVKCYLFKSETSTSSSNYSINPRRASGSRGNDMQYNLEGKPLGRRRLASLPWCKTPPSGRWRWPGSSAPTGLWCNWPPWGANRRSKRKRYEVKTEH